MTLKLTLSNPDIRLLNTLLRSAVVELITTKKAANCLATLLS